MCFTRDCFGFVVFSAIQLKSIVALLLPPFLSPSFYLYFVLFFFRSFTAHFFFISQFHIKHRFVCLVRVSLPLIFFFWRFFLLSFRVCNGFIATQQWQCRILSSESDEMMHNKNSFQMDKWISLVERLLIHWISFEREKKLNETQRMISKWRQISIDLIYRVLYRFQQ